MPKGRKHGFPLLAIMLTLLLNAMALAAPTSLNRLAAATGGEAEATASPAESAQAGDVELSLMAAAPPDLPVHLSQVQAGARQGLSERSGLTMDPNRLRAAAEGANTATQLAQVGLAQAAATQQPTGTQQPQTTRTQPPTTALPPPATLQTEQQWVLPSLTEDDWVLIKQPRPGGPMVVGYYAEDWEGDLRALESMRRAGVNLDRVVNFQLQINGDGSLTTRAYPALMAEAKQRGIPVYGLVHNFHDSNFSPAVARSVLGNPTVRTVAVENMIRVAQAQGLAGIDIDIENVPGDLREGYTALIRELASRLRPMGLGLSLSVPAKVWDDRTSNWGGAFDYRALGELADQVAVMAYDEHSFGLPAGPVASLGWVEKVAAYASSQIPAHKVLLGIAAYGYDWVVGTTQVRGLSVAGAMELAARQGSAIAWDDAAQVPYFTYWQNSTQRIVYFENSYSAAPKLELVKKYGLGGIALWRLGLEEERLWSIVESKLR